MNISQNLDSPLSSVRSIDSTENLQASNEQQTFPMSSSKSASDEVSISSLGNINQKIDSLFSQADAIYQSHITPAQRKTINESYTQLDDIFSSRTPSDAEQKNADALFSQIDKIFEQAEKQLTPSEKEQLEVIDTKLDELLGEDGIQLADIFSEELDKLFQQSEDLLTSKLSTGQKKTLDDLNQQLISLFEKNNVTDEGVDGLFDKIDHILNQGYDKLSNDEKDKLDNYDLEMGKLFDQRDQHEVEIHYP